MLKIMTTVLIALAAVQAQGAGRLLAGSAKADITPEQPVVSAKGESFRLPDAITPGDRISPDAINDPLYARVVVLKNDDVSLAIVSLDLILFSSRRVVAEAKRKWGVDHVILNCTHTHAGAVPRGMCPTNGGWGWTFAKADPGETLEWDAFSEDPWYAATEEKIIAAIGEASRSMFSARISATKGRYESEFMAHNRRLVKPDGTVTMMWSNPNRIPTEPIDPTLGVIRIDDDAGQPRVLMVHYACHPVMVMGAGKVSRDFPGAMVDHVEQEVGKSCMAMFLQGALGDLDPYACALRGEAGFAMVRRAGTALGAAALRLMKELEPAEPEAALRVKENMLTIPHRTGDATSRVCVTTMLIGAELALVAFPGEPFIEHQINLRKASAVPNTFLLGIAYCGQGSPYVVYIPTARAAQEGGYGAAECSFLAGEAGQMMVQAAAADIGELTGNEPLPPPANPLADR